MDFDSPPVKRWLGNNLEKGKRVYEEEERRAQKSFVKKYPFTKAEQFEFWVSIDDQGDINSPTQIVYVGETPGDTKLTTSTVLTSKYDWHINSNVFKYKYSSALYFGPIVIWNPQGDQQPFKLTSARLPFDLYKFTVF